MRKTLLFLITAVLFALPATVFAETAAVTSNSSTTISSKNPDEQTGNLRWHDGSMFVIHNYKNLIAPSQGFYQTRSLFKFSGLNIPAGAVINNAKLTVYVDETTGSFPTLLTLARVTSSWQDQTVSWNTQPSTSTVSTQNIHSASTNIAFDVTDLVRRWLSGSYTNYGLALYSDRRGDQEYLVVFRAAYYSVETRRPKLDINYTDNSPPVISNIRVNSLNSNSTAIRWTTDDASSTKVEFGRTTNYTNSSFLPAFVTDHSITISDLSPGTQYHFRVRSKNAPGLEGISSDRTLTTAIALNSPSPASGINFRALPVNLFNDNDNNQAQPAPAAGAEAAPSDNVSADTPPPAASEDGGSVFSRIEDNLEDKLNDLVEGPQEEAAGEAVQPEEIASEIETGKSAAPLVMVAGFFEKYRIVWILLLIILVLLSVIVFMSLHLGRRGFNKVKHHIKQKRGGGYGEEYSVEDHRIHPPAAKLTHLIFTILSIIVAILLIIASYFWGLSQQRGNLF